MASEDRTASRAVTLEETLASKPYRFSFYAAVRALECLNRDKPRVGESAKAVEDPVRLGQAPDLAFAPAELAAYEPGAPGRPPRLTGYFFGLFGPNGALPIHLTEYARDRLRNRKDPTFCRFADVFHHRLLSLFYRAWANAQPTLWLDRPESDRFSTYVGTLFGMGMPSLRDRDEFPDFAKLHHAGRFAAQTCPAEGLRDVIAGFFELPVAIRQFIGEWLQLPPDSHLRLGISAETGTLGRTAVAGERVWEYQQKFRIVFGPLNLDEFERVLPGGESLRRLVALVRNYIGDQLNWDVNLVLKKQEVPDLRLGQSGYLGWTSWLTPRPGEHDADDAIFDPSRGAAGSDSADATQSRRGELGLNAAA